MIARNIDADGRLVTKRLLSKTNHCPKWAERFIAARSLFIVEESVVDPMLKTMTTYTRNISLQNYMTIDEKVTYKVSLDNNDWTVAERSAWINSSFGYGLSRAVQAFGLDRFKKNVVKANRGFISVLDAMYTAKEVHDVSLYGNFHPWLKKMVINRAKNLSDAAKSKASPLIAAAVMTKQ